jgi:DNA-binding transcriptional MerR regulator
MGKEQYTVGQVAGMAHVTVRTLHHYDEIGLLVPSGRSDAGYRIYDVRDLDRLHEILVLRELGFPLEEIRGLLDEPPALRLEALHTHRERLETRIVRTRAVLRALDRRIEALKEERSMEETTAFEGFETFDHGPYEEEARERWGDTEAYAESLKRSGSYSPEQWSAMRAELERIEANWATLLAGGHRPEDAEAMDVAERARLHIDRWFYPCSHEMHVGLAGMYESDPRFRAHYDSREEGLAAFVAASIRANAERSG